jgi:hypothetical protein
MSVIQSIYLVGNARRHLRNISEQPHLSRDTSLTRDSVQRPDHWFRILGLCIYSLVFLFLDGGAIADVVH